MSDQPHSQFLISLTEFLRKACPEQDAYLIFEVLQEQEYPLTLEELAEHVIDEGYPMMILWMKEIPMTMKM